LDIELTKRCVYSKHQKTFCNPDYKKIDKQAIEKPADELWQ
jgi:hypothetical protein